MGLAQWHVEAAGISTIALSMVPDLTAAWGASRVAAIDFPCGRPLGQPRVAWPAPAGDVHWHPKEPSPIIQLLGRDPTLVKRLLDGDIPPEASKREAHRS